MKCGKYTVIGTAFDLFDWIGIGMIPILADVVDIFATIFWFTQGAGPIAAGSLIEVLPVADALPTNIAIGLYLDNKKGKKEK